jgi:hypothetical protein
MSEEEDYADNDLPPPFRFRLPAYLVSLAVGVGFSLFVCGGALFMFVLSRLR